MKIFGENNLKVIILAAGQGKRLQPLTKSIPKCLVKLFGKSLLEYQLDIFEKSNILDISIVTGYKSKKIKNPKITYFHNKNYEKTNMITSLFCSEKKMTDQIIVSYGDIIFEKKVINQLLKTKEDISVVIDQNWRRYWELRFKNPLDDAETLKIDSDENILEIGQKTSKFSEIHGQYIGLMKFQGKGIYQLKEYYKKAKQSVENGKNILNSKYSFDNSYMTDLLQGMINDGIKIKAVKINSGWLELDSLKDYNLYNKLFEEKKLDELFRIEG